MSRLRVISVLLAAWVPASAQAAEVTRVASSFEENDPFSLFLNVGFERDRLAAKITREHHQEGQVHDVNELRYVMTESRLVIDARVGIWQDLEFQYRLPIIFQQNQAWRYVLTPQPTTEEDSTITNNCIRPNGQLTDPTCPATGTGEEPLFGVPTNAYRGGMGNMQFGLNYAIFNQKKDPTKPVWVVGFNYEAPTADALVPGLETRPDARGPVGDRTHKYRFQTSLSRRIGVADPYFNLAYTLPSRGPEWRSNCDTSDPNRLSFPENCGTTFSRSETGIDMPKILSLFFGTEVTAYDSPEKGERVAFDFRGTFNYFTAGRYHNPLSDVLGRFLATDEYLQLGGTVGFITAAADYVHLRASASLLYDTEHYLTRESMGKDVDGNGFDPNNTSEINPSFDYRTDMVSRRFRVSEALNVRFDIFASFNF